MRKHQGMRPQDIVILLKILTWQEKEHWTFAELAHELLISPSEVTESLNRSKYARLIDYSKRQVARQSLFEFLVYGVRYVFPTEPSKIVRGIATAHSALPLSQFIVSQTDVYVWEYEEGDIRGQAIEPLYAKIPIIVQQSPKLYELLALVDAIRVGRAREYQLAVEILKQKIDE